MLLTQTAYGYIGRLDRGQEIVSSLVQIAENQAPEKGAWIQGLGAAEKISLAYYDLSDQEYKTFELEASHEITGFTGNITLKQNQLILHAHTQVANLQGEVKGGHLVEAYVSGTFEFSWWTMPLIERQLESETGLTLMHQQVDR